MGEGGEEPEAEPGADDEQECLDLQGLLVVDVVAGDPARGVGGAYRAMLEHHGRGAADDRGDTGGGSPAKARSAVHLHFPSADGAIVTAGMLRDG
jgi:hypothetical protein